MRYHSQYGMRPKIEACITMAGPQDESQIIEEVRQIFAKYPNTKEVILLFDHGQGERIEIIRPMKEENS